MGFQTLDDSAMGRSSACDHADNSVIDMLCRTSGYIIEKDIVVSGTGDIVAPVLQFTHSILVRNQWAELISITTLTNATDIYADIYDGSVSTKLTAGNPGGMVMSGAIVGSFFSKLQDETSAYVIHDADQARVTEPDSKSAGKPFIVTAKTGATNTIRFHLSTTDAPVSFTMKVRFEFTPMNGGTLVFL